MAGAPAGLPGDAAVLVTGASRGLGLAFVQRFLDELPKARVFAAARSAPDAATLADLQAQHGDRLLRVALDVTDEPSVERAHARVCERTDRLDLLLNAAGVLHDDAGLRPEKRVEDVTPANLEASFRVNAFGPLLMAKHFLPLLRGRHRALFASVSARVGSIGDNRLGGWYAYRGAKAAQNQFTRTLAVECSRRARNVIVVALHPGTTDTTLSRPFQANVPEGKLFSADRAAGQLCDVLAGLGPEDNGTFRDWRGEPVPW